MRRLKSRLRLAKIKAFTSNRAKAEQNVLKAKDLQQQLGRQIRLARVEAGLTQGELAEAIFVSQRCISLYELGEREPGVLTLRSIATALAKPVDWFLG